MLLVYQALLPEAYLLVLATSRSAHPEVELAQHLGRAFRSGRSAVWVDCRLLDALSPVSGRLLRRLHYCLQQRQAQLVLCRVSDELVRSLHTAGAVPPSGFVLADSLDEAASYLPRS